MCYFIISSGRKLPVGSKVEVDFVQSGSD